MDYQEALNDNGIVGFVTAEPTYGEDDYLHISHTDPRFVNIRTGWPDPGPMSHEKLDVEILYFSGSDFSENNMGFNMNSGRIYPEVASERARIPTSNAPANTTEISLEVVIRRVALLLNKPEGYVQPVLYLSANCYS